MPANNRKNPFFLAPALALAVSVLLLVLGFLEGNGGIKTSVLVLIFTLLAFGLPLLLFCVLRGAPALVIFPFRRPKKKELFLAIAALFLLVFSMAVFKYAWFRLDFSYREIALYSFSLSYPESIGEWLWLFFSFAVVPAIVEELVFRGAVYYEYRMAGAFVSALMSALLSSLLYFSFAAFPFAFLCSLLFALVRFLTGNLAMSMLVHFAYGLYTLTFEKYIWFMSISEESRTLFFVLSVIFFGGSLVIFLHFAEKMLRERAKAGENEPSNIPKNKRILVLFDVLTAPSLWMLLCVYLIVAVVRLFVS